METQIPTFFPIITVRVHDMKAIDVIPNVENSINIFNLGYNDFKQIWWSCKFRYESSTWSNLNISRLTYIG